MNTLFIHTDLNALGGAEQYVRDVIYGWTASANTATLFTMSGRTDPICGAAVTVLEPRASLAQRVVRRAFRQVGLGARLPAWYGRRVLSQLDHSVNIVVCGHLNVLPVSAHVARALQVPLVLVTYGIDIWRLWSEVEVHLLQQCHKIVALSRYTQDSIVRRLGTSVQTKVIHPGVDTTFFTSAPLPNESAMPRLLTVARLDGNERYKGHDIVLGAVRRLKESGLHVAYDIVGDGSDRPRLESLASRMGIRDRVFFHGAAKGDALRSHYHSCTLFVMPSYVTVRDDGRWTGEGFGIVYAEAGACGRAAIGCDVGGQTDIIEDRVTGRLVPPNEFVVADAIMELIRRPALNRVYAAAAERRVRESFGYCGFHAQWNELILETAASQRG